MEGEHVLVVVPQRPQRLDHLARSGGVLAPTAVGQTRESSYLTPIIDSPSQVPSHETKRVYWVQERCSSYSGAWTSQPVQDPT